MDNNEKAKALEAELASLDNESAQQPEPAPAPVQESVPEQEPQVTPEQVTTESKEPKQEERVERKVYSITLDKHNKQLENARIAAREEALREAEEKYKSQTVQPKETSDDVKAFADEHDMDENVVNKLLDLAAKRVSKNVKGLPEDIEQEFANLKQQREIQAAKQQFNDEFASSVLPLITQENPNVTQAQVQEIKARLDDLAFSSKYNTYALEDIYRVKSHEFDIKPKMSVESSRGGSRAGTVDFSNITPDDFAKLSPAEADKYFQWEKSQGKGSKYLN